MKKILSYLLVLLGAAIPLIYLAFVYSSLPSSVPLHFGPDGLPDRMGDKNELLTSTIILSVITVFIFLVVSNIYRIDPKKYASSNADRMQTVGIAVAVFLGLINFGVIRASFDGKAEIITKLTVPAIGVLFAIIGNYFTNLKPNYFMGLRLPWTLESEQNWRLTHQVAAKWWFWGGIAIAAITIFLHPLAQLIVMGIITTIIVIVPIVFSYRYYQKEKNTVQ